MVASGEIQPGDILERVSRLEVWVESLSESAAQRFDDMNRRLDDMSRRIDELSRRVDTVAGEMRREMRSEFNKLTYLILGTGAAIIAAVLATQLFT